MRSRIDLDKENHDLHRALDASRAEVAALREEFAQLSQSFIEEQNRHGEARTLLARWCRGSTSGVPVYDDTRAFLDPRRDECECPVEGHNPGCERDPLVRARDEARPEHLALCGVDCAWDCPIGGAQECERCKLVGICETHAQRRDEARGAPECPHYPDDSDCDCEDAPTEPVTAHPGCTDRCKRIGKVIACGSNCGCAACGPV